MERDCFIFVRASFSKMDLCEETRKIYSDTYTELNQTIQTLVHAKEYKRPCTEFLDRFHITHELLYYYVDIGPYRFHNLLPSLLDIVFRRVTLYWMEHNSKEVILFLKSDQTIAIELANYLVRLLYHPNVNVADMRVDKLVRKRTRQDQPVVTVKHVRWTMTMDLYEELCHVFPTLPIVMSKTWFDVVKNELNYVPKDLSNIILEYLPSKDTF